MQDQDQRKSLVGIKWSLLEMLVIHFTVRFGCLSLMMSTNVCFQGAFGSGAAFGMEDGWTLARAIELAYSRDPSDFLSSALQIFEEIRLPYYRRMYASIPA